MKTAKQLKCIADEKNSVSKEEIIKASDWCFERVVEILDEKTNKSAEAGCYSESVDIEPYLKEAVKNIPYLKKDEVRKFIIKRIRKYYKSLGFVVGCYDLLDGRLALQVWWC